MNSMFWNVLCNMYKLFWFMKAILMLLMQYTPMKTASSTQQNMDSLPLSQRQENTALNFCRLPRMYFNNVIKLKVLWLWNSFSSKERNFVYFSVYDSWLSEILSGNPKGTLRKGYHMLICISAYLSAYLI